MKLSKGLHTQENIYHFNGDKNNQRAEIIFTFINQSGLEKDSEWMFKKCNFTPISQVYTESDWEFLAALADKIKEISKTLSKTK